MTMLKKFRKVLFPLLKLVEWITSSRKLKHKGYIMVTDCKALHMVLMQSNWLLYFSNKEAVKVMIFSFPSGVVYSTTKIKVISWLITSIVLSRKEHSFSLYDIKKYHAVQNHTAYMSRHYWNKWKQNLVRNTDSEELNTSENVRKLCSFHSNAVHNIVVLYYEHCLYFIGHSRLSTHQSHNVEIALMG